MVRVRTGFRNGCQMDFLVRLQESGLATWVSQSGSLLGYPTFLFMHTLGLGTVAGLSGALNLRVLGVAPGIPLASLARFFTAIWVAFAVTAISGTVLLITDAVAKLSSPIFYVKLTFIVLALVNVRLLRASVFRDPNADRAPIPGRAKALALACFVCWIGATTAGRLMAYLGPL
jgi:hypothetical protein